MAQRLWFKAWIDQRLGDLRLNSCDVYGRAVWLGLEALLWKCEPAGHLALDGKPIQPEAVARQLALDPETLKRGIDNLVHWGLVHWSPEGVLVCTAIVELGSISEVRAKAGKRGARGRKPIQDAQDGSFAQAKSASKTAKQNVSSSSTSTSTSSESPLRVALAELPKLASDPQLPALEAFWPDFERHRREIRHPLTQGAVREQLRKAEKWGIPAFIAQGRESIAGGWQNIFEPKPVHNGNGYHRPDPPKKPVLIAPRVEAPGP